MMTLDRLKEAAEHASRGNARAALQALTEAAAADPDSVDVRLRLGDLYFNHGAWRRALECYVEAAERAPRSKACLHRLAAALRVVPSLTPEMGLVDALEQLLEAECVEPQDLAGAAMATLLRRPSMQGLLSLESAGEVEAALRSGALEALLEDSLVHRVLRSVIVTNLSIERRFTWLRKALLRGPRHEEMARSLAAQGEHNEYSWYVSEDERDADDAMYRTDAPEARVPTMADRVSAAVQQQYEENPYPRWQRLAVPERWRLPARLQALFPHWTCARPELEQPRVLVGGCGTGRDALMVASTYVDARVTAVDLSRASLAYATRQAAQRDVRNVTFHHADILHLGSVFDGPFDVVHSTGVLHHMADPEAGWKVLVDLLAPGGVMKIALYSERAREGFTAARRLVQANGFPPTLDGVRAARRAIADLPREAPERASATTSDFYYSSGCRDLLFHVQEHRFTIPRIREAMERLGLRFVGFEIAQEVNVRYDALFPDDRERTRLAFWEKFEDLYPETFRGMYQFWCEKVSP